MPKRTYCYDYPRPAVTADALVFTIRDGQVHALLIRRGKAPYRGRWAIPGGFLELDETGEEAARRELAEETGVTTPWPLEPIGFFDAPDRDPRGRTISLAFASICTPPGPEPTGSDDAQSASWVNVRESPGASGLAFDHEAIFKAGLIWLLKGTLIGHVGLALLPDPFTLRDAQVLLRAVRGHARGASAWVAQVVENGWAEVAGTKPRCYRRVAVAEAED